MHERQIENRRQEVTMHRRWVQAVFTYAPEQAGTFLFMNQDVQSSTGGKTCSAKPSAGQQSASYMDSTEHMSHMQPPSQDQHSLMNDHKPGSRPLELRAHNQSTGVSNHQTSEAHDGSQASVQPPEQIAGTQQLPGCEQPNPNASHQTIMQQEGDQSAAAAATPTADVVQQQEWEEGGTRPGEEPLTGCLFAEDCLQEVLPCSC